jgi:hypothetical protein
MSAIASKYAAICARPSDINQHLPTLYEYASRVDHVTECGVETGQSSYAFANALRDKPTHKLVQVDIKKLHTIPQFHQDCAAEGVNVLFHEMSDLVCPMEETDLLFIDTWHVYGHLKRELDRWHSSVKQYIILHDTTVDEWYGETIRRRWDADAQSRATGIPIEEINMGLWPAVAEFLVAHREWVLEKRYTNNNGLTILRRV